MRAARAAELPFRFMRAYDRASMSAAGRPAFAGARGRIPALVTCVALMAGAAPAHAEPPGLTLTRERDDFLGTRRDLMLGLGAWSLLSIAAGTLLVATDPFSRSPDPDPRRRAFRQSFGAMTLTFGVINGALAAGTLAGLSSQRRTLDTLELVRHQRRQSGDVFTANVGLDMIYITVGAALWSWGPSATARGTGAGFATQGGFVLGFDTLASVVHR